MKLGEPCTFYHDGGHGSQYWARGWRYGIIREIPTKGRQVNFMRIEVSRGYNVSPELVWIHSDSVNEAGDSTYHGPKLREVVAERKELKVKQQAKADKRKRN